MLFEREEKDEEEVEMVGEECASGKSYYRVAQNCVCVWLKETDRKVLQQAEAEVISWQCLGQIRIALDHLSLTD